MAELAFLYSHQAKFCENQGENWDLQANLLSKISELFQKNRNYEADVCLLNNRIRKLVVELKAERLERKRLGGIDVDIEAVKQEFILQDNIEEELHRKLDHEKEENKRLRSILKKAEHKMVQLKRQILNDAKPFSYHEYDGLLHDRNWRMNLQRKKPMSVRCNRSDDEEDVDVFPEFMDKSENRLDGSSDNRYHSTSNALAKAANSNIQKEQHTDIDNNDEEDVNQLSNITTETALIDDSDDYRGKDRYGGNNEGGDDNIMTDMFTHYNTNCPISEDSQQFASLDDRPSTFLCSHRYGFYDSKKSTHHNSPKINGEYVENVSQTVSASSKLEDGTIALTSLEILRQEDSAQESNSLSAADLLSNTGKARTIRREPSLIRNTQTPPPHQFDKNYLPRTPRKDSPFINSFHDSRKRHSKPLTSSPTLTPKRIRLKDPLTNPSFSMDLTLHPHKGNEMCIRDPVVNKLPSKEHITNNKISRLDPERDRPNIQSSGRPFV